MSDAIIRIEAHVRGTPHPAVGEYVKWYSPSGHRGAGKLITTPHRERAKRYPSKIAALEEYRAISCTHPWRRDGKPNRPLTAFTVEIQRA